MSGELEIKTMKEQLTRPQINKSHPLYCPQLVEVATDCLPVLSRPLIASAVRLHHKLPYKQIFESPAKLLGACVLMASQDYKTEIRTSDNGISTYRRGALTGSSAMRFDVLRMLGKEAGFDGLRFLIEKEGVGMFIAAPFWDEGSRVEGFNELLSDQKLEDWCDRICKQLSESAVLHISFAINLAKEFPKTFDDPFLRKATLVFYLFRQYCSVLYGIELMDPVANPMPGLCDMKSARILAEMGALRVDPAIEEVMVKNGSFEPNGPEETALRAASWEAIRHMSMENAVAPRAVDTLLWRQRNLFKHKKLAISLSKHY